MKVLGVLLFLVVVSSCGKSNSSAGYPKSVTQKETQQRYVPVDGSNIKGLYMAKFITLNGDATGNELFGRATLQRLNDDFKAYVKLSGGTPGTFHKQHIHVGSRCPGNRDGFIDIKEALYATGKILVPLDSDLSSQRAGNNKFPVADESGSYYYEKQTSFKNLFEDLKSFDTNSNDQITKLPSDSGLDFEGMVVMILGTQDDVYYPETVASMDKLPVHQTLPIACGLLAKVTSIPNDPQPEPRPAPMPDPVEDEVEPTPEESEHEDQWYERLIEWWRRTWERDRGGRVWPS